MNLCFSNDKVSSYMFLLVGFICFVFLFQILFYAEVGKSFDLVFCQQG